MIQNSSVHPKHFRLATTCPQRAKTYCTQAIIIINIIIIIIIECLHGTGQCNEWHVQM